jgi:hypothetical protein
MHARFSSSILFRKTKYVNEMFDKFNLNKLTEKIIKNKPIRPQKND